MELARAKSLKRELETAFLTATPAISVLEGLAENAPQDKFLQSLREVPLRQLDRVMAASAHGVLSLAVRGRAVKSPLRSVVAHGGEQPKPRMAVGYGLRERDEFQLEVRLQYPDVYSLLKARRLVDERAAGKARIGVLKQLAAHSAVHPAALNNDPLTLGSSVGHATGAPGTLGLFVSVGTNRGFLSCSHVLAKCGKAVLGDAVFHPAPNDDRKNAAVGTLRRFVDLSTAGPHSMDAALAILEEGRRAGDNRIPKGHGWPREGSSLGRMGNGPVSTPRPVVAKIGRSTGWTKGRLIMENLGPLAVYMPELGANSEIVGLSEIEWEAIDEPFSKGGDSGSLVYFADSLEPLGILVAGGKVEFEDKVIGASYACPLAPILKNWKLTLLQ